MRPSLFLVLLCLIPSTTTEAQEHLIAHWPLASDGRDISGNGLDANLSHVAFDVDKSSGQRFARFNGHNSSLSIAPRALLNLGHQDFTIHLRVRLDPDHTDVPGDLISQYDPETRRGFHLAIKTNAGVTFSQANDRQLQFAIDDNRTASTWTNCGRPGDALLPFALCEFQGDLYTGTCEPAREAAGHVYRYAGGTDWIDCGSPDRSNAVTSLIVFGGNLYAGTGKYRVRGSSLPESENENLGGSIFRYEGGQNWTDCGHLPEAEAVGGLVVFGRHLYASSLYRPAGFFRYEGGTTWTDCGSPRRPDDLAGETTHMRIEALAVHDGWLYGSSYDGGRIFRFDGKTWHDCGHLGDNTQTYSFAILAGQLYVGTWPSGRVYRFEAPHQWIDAGRLGDELEVMGMLVHNGRLIAGTLPLAQVYEFDGNANWRFLTQLDHTPDVRYRRAWTMAEHAGQVYCSTLPSGKVFSWRAGRVAMASSSLSAGWHDVTAMRKGSALELYVDAELVGRESADEIPEFDLSNGQPLLIGRGPNASFHGHLSDVRLFARALTSDEIESLIEE